MSDTLGADAMLTPHQVIAHLSSLGRELESLVRQLKQAETGDGTDGLPLGAVFARHKANIAESKAFLRAEGSMDMRKHEARVVVADLEEQALVAEALVRHLRASTRALEARIEIGRSLGVALRGELKLLPFSEGA